MKIYGNIFRYKFIIIFIAFPMGLLRSFPYKYRASYGITEYKYNKIHVYIDVLFYLIRS